jgi:hypothetical protein
VSANSSGLQKKNATALFQQSVGGKRISVGQMGNKARESGIFFM